MSNHNKQHHNDNKNDENPCRYLTCAINSSHTKSVEVLLVKRQQYSKEEEAKEENEEDGNDSKTKKNNNDDNDNYYDDDDDTLRERVVTKKRKVVDGDHHHRQHHGSAMKIAEVKTCSSSQKEIKQMNEKKRRKNKKKNSPIIVSTSTLPSQKLSSSQSSQPEFVKMDSSTIVSPMEAIKMKMNCQNKDYNKTSQTQIQIHVKPLLILDINGILCHRIRGRHKDLPTSILSKLMQIDTFNEKQKKKKKSQSSLLLPTTFATTKSNESLIDERLTEICKSIYREPIGYVACTPIIPRTDLCEFMSFLKQHFTLAIWSSAKKKTVNSLVKLLFRSSRFNSQNDDDDIISRFLFIWGQNKCECIDADSIIEASTTTNKDDNNNNTKTNNHHDDCTTTNDNNNEIIHRKPHFQGKVYIKKLSKVWSEYPLWNKDNTLLIDDSPDKCVEYRLNSVHPPPLLGINTSLLMKKLKMIEMENYDDFDSTLSDDLNEKKQKLFFEKLAEMFQNYNNKGDNGEISGSLSQFLSLFGRDHMNWRG